MSDLFTTPPTAFARVAVERAIDTHPDGLTYGVPEDIPDLRPGERVVVPLGRGDRSTAGYVLEVSASVDGIDPARIKSVLRREAGTAALPGELLELARWIGAYYVAPIGMTLASMLPAAVKRNVGARTRTLLDLGEADDGARITPKQRAVLDAIAALPDGERPVEINRLLELAELGTRGPITRLVDRGLLVQTRRTAIEAAWAEQAVDTRVPERLTDAQRGVVDAIGGTLGDAFAAHLLFGVTGSGKTEVYIRLIERVVAAGRAALVLVPEIALTPQTGGRLAGRFGDRRVAILHSALTAAQRHQQWSLIASGAADIVIGARSAVFAPIPDGRLGLIVVDEEHDHSYKQDQSPRYHGRDVAIRRAQLARCPIVLASATPSLESWHNATGRGRFALHRLTERAPGLRLPRVDVVDMVEERRMRRSKRQYLVGPTLERAIGATLDADGQVLLLLNRRGYASYIACPDAVCGWILGCDHCDVTMVHHRKRELAQGGFVRCHHCDAAQRLLAKCPQCERRLVSLGLGTQRLEEELANTFPGLVLGDTMLRVDSDTVRRGKDFHDALARFGSGAIRVLLGTQMIAKGLDFPGVRLVGVINADTALHLPDFRSTERTFQLVSQVVGRTGRGVEPGRAIVQTFQVDHPAIRLAAAHDFESFARREIEDRAGCAHPPITRMARIVVRDEDHARCVAAAEQLAAGLRPLLPEGVRLEGPMPCTIARIAGRHRHEVDVTAPDAPTLAATLAAARRAGLIRSDARMAVDVDPTSMM